MDKLLETQNLARLNHEEIETLDRPLIRKGIESVMKNLPRKKTPGPDDFPGKFY